jgi:membrane associated rhomboid family serine protease
MDVSVAYWAHVGGFIAGLILSMILRPKLRVARAYNRQDFR